MSKSLLAKYLSAEATTKLSEEMSKTRKEHRFLPNVEDRGKYRIKFLECVERETGEESKLGAGMPQYIFKMEVVDVLKEGELQQGDIVKHFFTITLDRKGDIPMAAKPRYRRMCKSAASLLDIPYDQMTPQTVYEIMSQEALGALVDTEADLEVKCEISKAGTVFSYPFFSAVAALEE